MGSGRGKQRRAATVVPAQWRNELQERAMRDEIPEDWIQISEGVRMDQLDVPMAPLPDSELQVAIFINPEGPSKAPSFVRVSLQGGFAQELCAQLGEERETLSSAVKEAKEWIAEAEGDRFQVRNPEIELGGKATRLVADRTFAALGKTAPSLVPEGLDKLSF